MIWLLMKKQLRLLFFALFLLFFQQSRAQTTTSIIPDISETYLDKLIEVAKANYPSVRSYQTRVDMAKDNVKKTRISYLDVISFSYIYQPHSATVVGLPSTTTTGSTTTTSTTSQPYSYFNGIQAGVFFNFGTYLQKPYLLRQAKSELKIANNEQEEYLLTLVNDVKKRYYTYVMRQANVRIQTQSALDAEEMLKSVRHRFEKGEETYENYNRAQVALASSNQSRMAAETDLLIAKADLEQILGEKLENIK